MSQAIHFLDFSLSPQQLRTWREVGLRNRYNQQFSDYLDYQAPIFLDSGGFKLLWNETLDLSNYDLCVKQEQGPSRILNLQRDLGGDIVASLDYPLPTGLSVSEAHSRMSRSRDNAVAAARLLQNVEQSERPFLHIASHGQDREGIAHYVSSVLQELHKENLDTNPFGLAVGSLVPLRRASNHIAVVNIVKGLRDGLGSVSDVQRAKIPVHAFGVTGTLIPLLAYLGVDSFDSSTYVQKGRNVTYIHPDTYKDVRVFEMDELTCTCAVCRDMNLADLHNALLSQTKNQPQRCGFYKSKYYGDICLHNLEMDFRMVERMREAITADEMHEFLVEHAGRFPELQLALHAVAEEDEPLRQRLNRTSFSLSSLEAKHLMKKQKKKQGAQQILPQQEMEKLPAKSAVHTITLNHRPEDFDIGINGYEPPLGKSLLLVLPCSETKPYGDSRTHRHLMTKLSEAMGERIRKVHKVTLSGLYGPVPEEREDEEAILSYDFRLEVAHSEQMALVSDRLATYIRRHHERYDLCLGYATTLAYRLVLERAAHLLRQESQGGSMETIRFPVLPLKPKVRRLTEFFRHDNIEEVVNAFATLTDHNEPFSEK